MAKIKLDWFKLDCQPDDKLRLIQAEFGLTGFAIIVKLYMKIYGGEFGYYCEWTKEVALLFAQDNGVGINVVSEIIACALKRGIFNKEMFEKYSILTSHGIQARYFDVASRRKNQGEFKYLLLCNTQKSKDVDISSENVDISNKNVDIFSQRRKEKKREDNIRIDKTKKREHSLLTKSEFDELSKMSCPSDVKKYILKITDWQDKNNKVCKNPFETIKSWITQDKQASRRSENETSYDLDAWAEFANNYSFKLNQEESQ